MYSFTESVSPMHLAEKLDQELLIYLDRNYGHLLSASDASLPSVEEQFGAKVLRVEPLDQLQLLVSFACPPSQMALRAVQGLAPLRRPEALETRSIASVRSLSACWEAVKKSSHRSGVARLDLTTDPHYRDPSTHPGFSHLPLHWRISYSLFGKFRVLFLSLARSLDNNASGLRYAPVLLVLVGLLVSLNQGPGKTPSASSFQQDSSFAKPTSPSKEISQSEKDSVMASAGVPRLRGLREALTHFPARPPVPDSLISVSSEYGWRPDPLNGDSSIHGGVDFAVPTSTVLSAPARGVVSDTGRNSRSGRYLRLDHSPLPYQSSFAHLSDIFVEPGDTVYIEEPVATAGSSGRVTGPHLHFRVDRNDTPVDPADLYRQFVLLRDSFMTQAERTQRAFDQSIRRVRSRSDSMSLPLEPLLSLRSKVRPLLTLPKEKSP